MPKLWYKFDKHARIKTFPRNKKKFPLGEILIALIAYEKSETHTISITQANIEICDQSVAPLFPPSLLNRCGWKIQQFYIFKQTVN